jgi:enoyl-CoA hydratase
MGEFVRVEIDQAVATIRLDRPPMNGLNAQVQAEIAAAAAHVGEDPAIRAVILYGGQQVGPGGPRPPEEHCLAEEHCPPEEHWGGAR